MVQCHPHNIFNIKLFPNYGAVKIELTNYAAQHGVMATLRHYVPKHPGLKESTI